MHLVIEVHVWWCTGWRWPWQWPKAFKCCPTQIFAAVYTPNVGSATVATLFCSSRQSHQELYSEDSVQFVPASSALDTSCEIWTAGNIVKPGSAVESSVLQDSALLPNSSIHALLQARLDLVVTDYWWQSDAAQSKMGKEDRPVRFFRPQTGCYHACHIDWVNYLPVELHSMPSKVETTCVSLLNLHHNRFSSSIPSFLQWKQQTNARSSIIGQHPDAQVATSRSWRAQW